MDKAPIAIPTSHFFGRIDVWVSGSAVRAQLPGVLKAEYLDKASDGVKERAPMRRFERVVDFSRRLREGAADLLARTVAGHHINERSTSYGDGPQSFYQAASDTTSALRVTNA